MYTEGRNALKKNKGLQFWLLLLGLIIFPPVGIAMVWLGKKNWSKNAKRLVTGFAALWFLVLMVSGGENTTDYEDSTAPQISVQDTMAETVSVTEEPEVTAPVPEKLVDTSPLLPVGEVPTYIPTPEPTPEATPEPTPELTPSNLLLQQEIHIVSYGANGESRAFINFYAGDMTLVLEEEYKGFCDVMVTGALYSGYSHFTVDFLDGTGIVYPDCTTQLAEYSNLNDDGLTSSLIYAISYSNDNVAYILPTP